MFYFRNHAFTGFAKSADPGANQGFLKRAFKCRKGGFVCLIDTKFLEIPHENKIIWLQWWGGGGGVQAP